MYLIMKQPSGNIANGFNCLAIEGEKGKGEKGARQIIKKYARFMTQLCFK